MRTNPVPNLAATAATAAVASVLSASIVLGFQGTAPASEPVREEPIVISSPERDANSNDVSRQLDELASMIRGMRVQRIEAAQATPSTPETATDEPRARHDSGRAVSAHLTRIATTARGRVGRHLAANWYALTSLRTLAERDKKQADREVQLMTVPEVVARFGFPTKITTANSEIVLRYSRKNPRTKANETTVFHVLAGYVTSLALQDQQSGMTLGNYLTDVRFRNIGLGRRFHLNAANLLKETRAVNLIKLVTDTKKKRKQPKR